MNLGPYATFILGAYGVATLIVLAMVAWVVIDNRRQARALADLEARGVTRRSTERQGATTSGAAS
jgi:heme exporter protein D